MKAATAVVVRAARANGFTALERDYIFGCVWSVSRASRSSHAHPSHLSLWRSSRLSVMPRRSSLDSPGRRSRIALLCQKPGSPTR